MVYYGTNISEKIMIHPAGEQDNIHFIKMTKYADAPMFSVTYCCDEAWNYTFWMENNSDYERVKMVIMDCIFECEDMDALIRILGEALEDGFEDILVTNECNGDCEHCEHHNDEYDY